jgi:cell division protein FtsZ
MKDAGPALIGLGRGSGEGRAAEAAREAIAGPLLEASIEGAHSILLNVSGPADLRLREVQQAAEEIRAHADADANIIFGASFSKTIGEDVLVTLIATRLNGHARSVAAPLAASSMVGRGRRDADEVKGEPRRPARPIRQAPVVDVAASAVGAAEAPAPPAMTFTASTTEPSSAPMPPAIPPTASATRPEPSSAPTPPAMPSTASGQQTGSRPQTASVPKAESAPEAPSVPPPSLSDGELEVPSFLRRRRQPSSRD